jgi:predicted Zn-dependent protease
MKIYTSKSVARLLDLSVGQVRAFARAGFLDPERGPHGEYRFSFRDLVLLRTAKGLAAARVPPRRIRVALRRLREQLPRSRPLTGLRISATGDHVIVRDGDSVWQPETGQSCFNFDVGRLARRVAPHTRRAARRSVDSAPPRDAEGWCAVGAELEAAAPAQAQEAYRRALDLDPDHFDTRVNLGRLLHEEGKVQVAEMHYRRALSVRPQDPTALFNLAVCLEDLGRTLEAIGLYRQAIRSAPESPDAYYNLARLYQQLGDTAAALRHLQVYRKLTERH